MNSLPSRASSPGRTHQGAATSVTDGGPEESAAGDERARRRVMRVRRLPAIRTRLHVDAERLEQPARSGRHLLDGRVECGGVAARRLAEPADLPNELASGSFDLARRGRRLGPTERLDASTHGGTVAAMSAPRQRPLTAARLV